jgi:hypothetical protein
VPEVARVLSPGGRLGLIWNIRDEREDWVRQLGQTMHGDEDPRAPAPVLLAPRLTGRHELSESDE